MKTTCRIVCIISLLIPLGCSKKPEPTIEQVRAENLKRAAKVKADDEQIEMFALASQISASLLERAKLTGKVEQSESMKSEPTNAAEMEAALIKKAVKKEDVREHATRYVFNMRELIKLIREKSPELKPWADQMQPLLLNLEAAAM